MVDHENKLRLQIKQVLRRHASGIELRSTPQGHPAYRRVVQQMHDLIRDEAGHTAIADAMRFVDHGMAELERLDSERAAERRREARA